MFSPAYAQALEEAKAHHAASKTYSGKFLRPHKPVIAALIQRHEIRSAIDWGCGKGEQYAWIDPEDGKTLEEAWGFEVFKHDPAWPPFEKEPDERADLVLCTHVLGSIPTVDLPEFLSKLFWHARKVVYIAEKLGPVKKGALSKPQERAVGWSGEQWEAALSPLAEVARRSVPAPVVYLSTREIIDDEVIVMRRRWSGPENGWIVEAFS